MPGKKHDEHNIDPDSFYQNFQGDYTARNKKKISMTSKSDSPSSSGETIIDREEMLPELDKQYKETANKTLEEIGAGVRVYNKNSYNLLLSILVGVIILFGLFFVWSVSNDKFKQDCSCPDLSCPQAQLTCPAVENSDCICNQTLSCPQINSSAIIGAINNISLCHNSTG
jgi:hypothetical protein